MKVRCSSYDYKKNKWVEFDVSVNLKVYPCCAYHGYYELNPWDDKRFKNLPEDWNDLKIHDFETIKRTMLTILNLDNFNNGKAPKKCQSICGIGIAEKTMPGRDVVKLVRMDNIKKDENFNNRK